MIGVSARMEDKMSKPNDGGPAFPRPGWEACPDGNFPGMTLRDYFAIHSVLAAGILSGKKPSDEVTAQELAENCYKIADALIAEREKRSS